MSGLELINNGENGFIVKCEDKEDLIDKTNQYFSLDINKKRIIQNKILNTIKKYSIENMAREQMKILER